MIRGEFFARGSLLVIFIMTPFLRASSLSLPVSTSTPATPSPSGLISCLPVLNGVLSPAVLQVLMDINQVPGLVRDGLHPDFTDALLLRSLLMVCSGHVVQETFRLVEADPAKEAVISALPREKSFAHM